jgi:pre-mRNA-splicing helicase BRR2
MPTKVNILFQTHFSRQSVGQELGADRDKIIVRAIPLLWALIDLFSTEQYLKSTLICPELCQMMCQALWDTDSSLLQLPHVTRDIARKFKLRNIEGIFDLIELEEHERDQLLSFFNTNELKNIAKICNLYPNLEVNFQLQTDIIYKSENMKILVNV